MRISISPVNFNGIKKDKHYKIHNETDLAFSISSEQIDGSEGVDAFCMKKGCAHLNGGDWEIIDSPKKN